MITRIAAMAVFALLWGGSTTAQNVQSEAAHNSSSQVTVLLNISAPTVDGPGPGQTAYLVSVKLTPGLLNAKGRTFDAVASGMVTGGWYSNGQAIQLLVNLCDRPSCNGSIVATIGSVGTNPVTAYPMSFRTSASLAVSKPGALGAATSVTQGEMFANVNDSAAVNVLQESGAVDLSKGLYLVIGWSVSQGTSVFGSPQITTDLLRVVVY